MSIGRICSRTAHLAAPEESARVAAARMRSEGVGTLVVVDQDRRPVGIVTDRDLALRVVAPGLDPGTATVGEVMTADPRWVGEQTPIEDAVATMRRESVRRLPVVDGDQRLIGIVSMDDVLELVAEELEDLGQLVGSSDRTREAVSRGRTVRARAPEAAAGLERASADLEC